MVLNRGLEFVVFCFGEGGVVYVCVDVIDELYF